MTQYQSPKFRLNSFNCPFCGAFSHIKWNRLFFTGNGSHYSDYYIGTCSCCNKESLWVGQGVAIDVSPHSEGLMVYPDFGVAPLPENDMPDDVKIDYEEASCIFSSSKRGAAALLRLALQKLLKHLGQEGKNINEDIRALAQNGYLPIQVIQVADTLRITGNNAVHPGTMSDEEFDDVAEKMFDLINFIVRKAITEPKELDELYLKVPESARKSAEMQDAKNAAKAQVGVK